MPIAQRATASHASPSRGLCSMIDAASSFASTKRPCASRRSSSTRCFGVVGMGAILAVRASRQDHSGPNANS